MKKESYLTIQSWMVTDLHLKGNELLAYALIYGFSQDEQSCFYGSYQYVMEWLGVDKTTAVRVLKKLEEKGLLRKWQEKDGGVTVNRYAANTEPTVPDPLQNATGGKMQPVAECHSDQLQNATQTGGKMQPQNTREKANNNKPRAGAREEQTPMQVFETFANGNRRLLKSLTEFDQHRRNLAAKDKRQVWTALAAKKICGRLVRQTDDAGVQDRVGYMIAMLDQAVATGKWLDVYPARDFVDRAPAVHTAQPAPDKPRMIPAGATMDEIFAMCGVT